MNSYRFNQLAMAVLAALVLFFGTRTLINIIYAEHEPEHAGYEVPGAKKEGEKAAEGKGEPTKEEGSQVLTLLASADPKKGESAVGICKGCHTLEKGGANMVGPNLWNIVERKVAAHEGYDYSPAIKEHGGEWDYANLDDMIKHPNVHIPGTKMAMYPGMPDAEKRANVIAYLRTLSDDPKPLPEAGGEGGDDSAAAEGGEAEESAPAEPTEGEADKATTEQKGPPAEPMSEEEEPSAESAPAEEPNAATDEDTSEAPADDAETGEEPNADAGTESESGTQ